MVVVGRGGGGRRRRKGMMLYSLPKKYMCVFVLGCVGGEEREGGVCKRGREGRWAGLVQRLALGGV